MIVTPQQPEKCPELVLVVDDDPTTLECLGETVRVMGLSLCVAEDGERALSLFEQKRPDVVVTDVRMPRMDGLALTNHIKARRPDTPVIVVTGYGDEGTAVAALRAGASDYLHKPFHLTELKHTINRTLSLIRSRMAENLAVLGVERLDWYLEIKNEPEIISGLLTVILRPVAARLAESNRLHLQVAVQELLLNAIEHGNLGISAEEKTNAVMNDCFDHLVEERQANHRFSRRRVKMWIMHDPENGVFQCRICDEGEGFDWRGLMDASLINVPALAGSGRGIFLVKTLMSDVEYHGQGNEVTLTFRYSPKMAGHPPTMVSPH